MGLDILFWIAVLELSICSRFPDPSQRPTSSPWIYNLWDLSVAVTPGAASIWWFIKSTSGRLPIYYQATEIEKACLEFARTPICAAAFTITYAKFYSITVPSYMWGLLTSDNVREALPAVLWLLLLLVTAVLLVLLAVVAVCTPWLELWKDAIRLQCSADEELAMKISVALCEQLEREGDVERLAQMDMDDDIYFD